MEKELEGRAATDSEQRSYGIEWQWRVRGEGEDIGRASMQLFKSVKAQCWDNPVQCH